MNANMTDNQLREAVKKLKERGISVNLISKEMGNLAQQNLSAFLLGKKNIGSDKKDRLQAVIERFDRIWREED